MPLRRSRLAQHPAGSTLGDPEPLAHARDDPSPPGRAQKFPEAASLSIALSSAWSATRFLRRPFSFSSSFRRLAWSRRRPPYILAPAIVRLLGDPELPSHLRRVALPTHLMPPFFDPNNLPGSI